MAEKKVPYSKKPGDLTLDEWQAILRQQFAREQKFKFKNIGDHPVFSDFEVYNPESGNTYKVSIRDNVTSYNFCSCPDFKITALGTCKHIEYLLYYFSKYKKYQKYLTKPYRPGYSSLSIYYGHEKKVKLKKSNNSVSYLNESDYFNEDGYLRDDCMPFLESFINKVIKTEPEFRVYPDVYEMISHHKKNKEREVLTGNLFPEGKDSKIFDGLINTDLYPYQKEGIKRIVENGRILLADEMGLGKTIQAIAATEILNAHFGVQQVLIICPTSLKYQWKKEIKKFTGREALVVEGLIHKRKKLYAESSFYKIISYGACRNDLDIINDLNPDLLILDEAQRIKNWKTKTAQSVKKINSEYAIVLTGTPLENRIDELHSIVELIDRYKLGPLFRFLDKHQVSDESGKLIGYKNLREINSTLEKILVRRTRKEIIDQLPGRVDKNYFTELTKEQARDHNSYYDIVSQLVNKWIRQGFLSEEDRQNLLVALNCMRMVCDSTYILNQKTNHGNKVDELMQLVGEILEEKENKILIFSQWKRMFELVIRELDKNKIPYVYLNGDIPAKKRKEIIDQFQSDEKIKIFLSTDAGGVGVNLQSANILINLDLPWNPAVLEQRISRIYRLGQKQHVNVFNFIARNSIEHRILYLLEFKKAVFEGVIEEDGKNEVMLEGFMESVKAMTQVNLEEEDPQDNGHEDIDMNINDEAITESQIKTREPEKENTDPKKEQINKKPVENSIQEKTGIFGRWRKKLKIFVKRVSKVFNS